MGALQVVKNVSLKSFSVFSRHEPADCVRAIKEILEVFENANNNILDIYKTSEVSITCIKVTEGLGKL